MSAIHPKHAVLARFFHSLIVHITGIEGPIGPIAVHSVSFMLRTAKSSKSTVR